MKRAHPLLLAFISCLALSTGAFSRTIPVQSVAELKSAIKQADPGDVILILPGEYALAGVAIARSGTRERPITLRGTRLGEARLEARGTELFKLYGSHWIFENLDIYGACSRHEYCEHAFHIVASASGTTIRNNRLRDFNAAIKGNGENGAFPNDVIIEGNTITNAAPRQTSNPVTPIDVVGGRRWIIRGNVISDFGKTLGDRTSYAAFLKGNSSDGIFDRNLVVCEWRHSGGLRVGLSLGGGGTGGRHCEASDCSVEHRGGLIVNNIIMNCPDEVGIYLNRASQTRIYNNTLYRTFGIVVRYPESTAEIRNNLISGSILSRDGGQVLAESNNVTTGSLIAPWVPGGLRYMKSKLLRANEKYPNYLKFDRRTLDEWSEMLARSWIGRGDSRFNSWFVDPTNGDFTLSGAIEHGPAQRGDMLLEVTHDFCNRPRDVPPHLGAVEPGANACSVQMLLVEKLGPRQ